MFEFSCMFGSLAPLRYTPSCCVWVTNNVFLQEVKDVFGFPYHNLWLHLLCYFVLPLYFPGLQVYFCCVATDLVALLCTHSLTCCWLWVMAGCWGVYLKDWKAWSCQVSFRGHWHLYWQEARGYCPFLPQLWCEQFKTICTFCLLFVIVIYSRLHWCCSTCTSEPSLELVFPVLAPIGARGGAHWLPAHWHLWGWICKLLSLLSTIVSKGGSCRISVLCWQWICPPWSLVCQCFVLMCVL